MSRVLVAGGAGFLGSHLTRQLLRRGDTVVIADDFSTGTQINVADLRAEFGDGDVLDVIDIDVCNPLVDHPSFARQFDRVCNAASPASPPAYARRAIETLRVGSLGTENLVRLALRDNARFLQFSTSEVYGDPQVHPQPESYWGHVNPIGPRSMYDEAKRYGEALTVAFERDYGLDLRLLRIFNTYGPGMRADDGRVVTNFISQALRGDNLTIYGTGEQTRSFCYVDDEVAGIIALLDSTHRGPMNIGNPGEFTMNELARLVLELTGSSSKVTYHELPGDDPTERKPDISLAKRVLGWEPTVALREGLLRTIEWFKVQTTESLDG
jgi:dTDP-glucose 4,6-dehydratase